MGNAVDNDHLILQPYEMTTLMPEIARLTIEARARGMYTEVGNNVGFFGPHEDVLRGDGRVGTAGVNVIGIDADGTIKGCPSLAIEAFGAGNIRERTVEYIWNYSERMHFGRMRGEFALITEPIPGRETGVPTMVTRAPGGIGPLIQIQISQERTIRKTADGQPLARGRKVKKLYPCRSCERHVFRQETTCPHCGVTEPVVRAVKRELVAV